MDANSNEGEFAFTLRPCVAVFHASHPAVLTLLIVNSDNLNATQYDAVFKSVGLDTISYTPASPSLPASGWPTLGSLIDAGTRLLTFLDNGADPTTVPYLLDGNSSFNNFFIPPPDDWILSKNSLTYGKLHLMWMIHRYSIVPSTGPTGMQLQKCIS